MKSNNKNYHQVICHTQWWLQKTLFFHLKNDLDLIFHNFDLIFHN